MDQLATPDQAAALEVAFDGRHYRYRSFRYESLDDALRYARADHARPGFVPDRQFQPQWLPAWQPDAQARALMTELSIEYRQGCFHLGPYRYDRLDDAVVHAQLTRGAPLDARHGHLA
jgi:hypothetical protein